MRAVSMFVVLMAYWLLLSGHYDIRTKDGQFFTGCGVLSCAFVVWLARRRFGILDDEGHPVHIAGRALVYVPWLLWQIVLSNWDVFKRVWHPALPIDPCVVRIPFETKTDLGTVIYANSITLTPGTVTVSVDADKREFVIHCLTKGVADDLQSGGMQAHVKRLEGSA